MTSLLGSLHRCGHIAFFDSLLGQVNTPPVLMKMGTSGQCVWRCMSAKSLLYALPPCGPPHTHTHIHTPPHEGQVSIVCSPMVDFPPTHTHTHTTTHFTLLDKHICSWSYRINRRRHCRRCTRKRTITSEDHATFSSFQRGWSLSFKLMGCSLENSCASSTFHHLRAQLRHASLLWITKGVLCLSNVQ